MVAETLRRGGAAPRDVKTSILSTKLVPPAAPAGFVMRPRLEEALDAASSLRVTLVSAHAGTGKTVLLATWAAGRSDLAWLTLDRADNWSPRFWAGVERALGGDDASGNGAAGGGHDPVARVVSRTAARTKPIVLVLDDLHEIENPVVLKELDALIAAAPPMLRIVLATRADPPLRLQRLRLAGELAELRASDLAFGHAESRALLAPLDLSDDDVRLLCARTEGWAVGLRLAALSLGHEQDHTRFISHFAGDERAVADYLLAEILDRQPPERRTFLLRACVPDILTPELAVALSGNKSAGRLLADLEAENFLVSSHEDASDCFRLHALLRDFLRTQLARDHPDELRIVNRRCARWFADHGDPDSAFRHAVVGEDWDLADELVAASWHTIVIGVGIRSAEYTVAVPADAPERRPGLAVRRAAELLAMGDRAGAEAVFERGVAELPDLPSERRALVAPLVETFRIALARLDGDHERLATLAHGLADLPVATGADAHRRARTQLASALASLGTAQVASGDFASAERNLEEGLAIAQEIGADVVALNSLSDLALLAAARDQLRRAVDYANEALEFARRRTWERLYHLAGARLALGWAYYNWDELSAAREHVERAGAVAQHWGDRAAKVGAAMLSARLLATEGQEGAAKGLRQVRGLRSDPPGWNLPAWLAPSLGAEARLLAARGDLDDTRELLDAAGASSDPDALLVRARLSLVGAGPAQALDDLGAADKWNELDVHVRIEARVLEAVAAAALNDRVRAAAALEDALALGEPGCFRRPFLDGGPVVQTLLVDQIRRGTSHRSFVADLVAAFDRRAAGTAITKVELLEPLSEREHAVLRYLPTMMSNAEIASELFVSVNTVKTHLKSVYRKLGTTRRRDAVERARRLELL